MRPERQQRTTLVLFHVEKAAGKGGLCAWCMAESSNQTSSRSKSSVLWRMTDAICMFLNAIDWKAVAATSFTKRELPSTPGNVCTWER
jgi:hypothetical protein